MDGHWTPHSVHVYPAVWEAYLAGALHVQEKPSTGLRSQKSSSPRPRSFPHRQFHDGYSTSPPGPGWPARLADPHLAGTDGSLNVDEVRGRLYNG